MPLTITEASDSHFEAECSGWSIFAKWDGCVEFHRIGQESEDHIHVCEIEQFFAAVSAAREEMKRREYEID